MIAVVIAPVLHNKVPVVPLTDKPDVPQLFTTLTTGVDGITGVAAIPDPAALVQPPTVCVTV